MAITLGPIIGHTTDTATCIWVRGEPLDEQPPRRYCYGAFDLYHDGVLQQSRYCHLKDHYDWTGLVRFDGLTPDTAYEVHCTTLYFSDAHAPQVQAPVNGPIIAMPTANDPVARFRTARAANDGRLRFAFGSCRYLFWDNVLQSDAIKGDKTFRSIHHVHRRDPLDLLLMIGDQIYADPLNAAKRYDSAEELFAVYQKSFGQPHIRRLMSEVTTYMVLDDHEIRNDWSKDEMRDANQGFYADAMRAYHSYQHLHNPATPQGQFWYTFQRGTFPFFVMDARTQRIVEPRGVETKTMLGREQLNAFLAWLHDHRNAPMKFVVCSVPFFPDPKAGDDKWAGFPIERSLILEYLRVERIRGVVFLSGDVHNSQFARMGCHQDPAFGITSLVSSPFYWPYPHESSSNFYGSRTFEFMEWAGPDRRVRDRIEYRYEGEGFIGDESFMVVDVDLARGSMPGQAIVRGRKGEPFEAYPNAYVFG